MKNAIRFQQQMKTFLQVFKRELSLFNSSFEYVTRRQLRRQKKFKLFQLRYNSGAQAKD